jgi:hypothetical protein
MILLTIESLYTNLSHETRKQQQPSRLGAKCRRDPLRCLPLSLLQPSLLTTTAAAMACCGLHSHARFVTKQVRAQFRNARLNNLFSSCLAIVRDSRGIRGRYALLTLLFIFGETLQTRPPRWSLTFASHLTVHSEQTSNNKNSQPQCQKRATSSS